MLMVYVYTETAHNAPMGTVIIVPRRFASHHQKTENLVFAKQFRLVVPAMILFSALQLLVEFNALQISALSRLGSPAPPPVIVLRIYV